MVCKIFSDDQEIATNQKIGFCDYDSYLRTEWLGIPSNKKQNFQFQFQFTSEPTASAVDS